jgi:hypothetical protein
MDASAALRLPAPVTAETLLPYSLWRVVALIDGQRTAAEVASTLGTPITNVTNALRDLERELGVTPVTPDTSPATDTSSVTLAPDDAMDLLVAITVEVMGPMGEVIVEDVIDELGEDTPFMVMAERIASELREPQRSAFIAKVRSKGLS